MKPKLSDLILHMEAGGEIRHDDGTVLHMDGGSIRGKRCSYAAIGNASGWSIVPIPPKPMNIHEAIASGKPWKRVNDGEWVMPCKKQDDEFVNDDGDHMAFTPNDINATDYVVKDDKL